MSEKLQKVLAAQGLGGRRTMEQWIEAGRVLVNGKPAEVGLRVTEDDRIAVDGKPLRRSQAEHRHLIYNKPAGQICSRDDPEGRPTVFRAPSLVAGVGSRSGGSTSIRLDCCSSRRMAPSQQINAP